MPKFFNPRTARLTAGIAVLAAFAAIPGAAQAADTEVTGTLTAGSLTNTAPAIAPFVATLTGVNQTVPTDVGAWSVTDATGSNDGYSITVAASDPTVDGSASAAGTGGTLTLTSPDGTAATGNPAPVGPTDTGAQVLDTDAATIENAAAGTGQGQWDFAATDDALSIVLPGDASAGAYSSTLTYTTAVPAV
jgi:hypothetical protein